LTLVVDLDLDILRVGRGVEEGEGLESAE